MKKTGEILRKEREARGLSLHEIGLSLKINSKILKAIEDGDTTQLPAKTFLRGFVQSYASYLKLNVDEILRIFADEMGSTRPQPTIKDTVADQTKTETSAEPSATAKGPTRPALAKPTLHKPTNLEETSSTKAIIFAVSAVILAGLITLTVKIIDKYQREAEVATIDVKPIEQVEVTEPTTGEPPVVATETKTETPAAPSTPTTAAPIVAPVVIPVLPTVTPAPPQPAKPAEPVVVEKKPSETTPAETKPVAEAKPPEPKPVEEKPAPQAKSIELIIEALDNVEIEYSSGSGKKEKTTLVAGQIHTFKSNAGLKLNVSNGGAVNVILNGKDVGVPGDLGKPIKLNY